MREPADEGPRFVIGIDLGTTNSAVAYVDLKEGPRKVSFLEIPQLVAPGETAGRSVLPSFLYLPGNFRPRTGENLLAQLGVRGAR